MKWRSGPQCPQSDDFVLRSINGGTYPDPGGTTRPIFPFPAFERLQEASATVLSSVFAYLPGR